jgi:integrase
MTLGLVTADNGLAAARQTAQAARALIGKGIDPIDERRRPTTVPAFAEASRELIESLAPEWRGRETKASWERSLLVYSAKLGRRPVDQIGVADVLEVVRPMWSTKPESAAKLRERIERVLDAQRAANAIRGPWENPARWRGHLAHILPKRQKLTRGHHPAMPYADAPAFLMKIRAQDGMGARALEFAILTAGREGVVMSARWGEIQGDLWVLSPDRLKTAKGHRVPLSPGAVALLERVAGAGREGWIFPGQRQKGRPANHISNATMDAVLKRMKLPYVPHGFRSTFRDWAGDCTGHPRDLIEEALAHQVGDETERAYRRSDSLAKRRKLMEDWATFLGGGAVIVPGDQRM